MSYPERSINARNSWLIAKVSHRKKQIAGIMIHATRSGKSYGDDGPRTEGWWSNPLNKVIQGSAVYGSYADVLIYENGTRVICTDLDNEIATWTAGYGGSGTWAAGYYYIQIEMAQGRPEDAYTNEQIQSLAEYTARAMGEFNFPLYRIPFLEQRGTPPRGICTHEDSANGAKLGKSDPGWIFPWGMYFNETRALLGPVFGEEDIDMKVVTGTGQNSGLWVLGPDGKRQIATIEEAQAYYAVTGQTEAQKIEQRLLDKVPKA